MRFLKDKYWNNETVLCPLPWTNYCSQIVAIKKGDFQRGLFCLYNKNWNWENIVIFPSSRNSLQNFHICWTSLNAKKKIPWRGSDNFWFFFFNRNMLIAFMRFSWLLLFLIKFVKTSLTMKFRSHFCIDSFEKMKYYNTKLDMTYTHLKSVNHGMVNIPTYQKGVLFWFKTWWAEGWLLLWLRN